MERFDIIEYLSGLTGYVFDIAVLKRIALERGVSEVSEYDELSLKDKELLRADLLLTAYLSPNVWASSNVSHGSFSKGVGSQTISVSEKERLYNSFLSIYKKYDDEKLEELESSEGNLQWLQ